MKKLIVLALAASALLAVPVMAEAKSGTKSCGSVRGMKVKAMTIMESRVLSCTKARSVASWVIAINEEPKGWMCTEDRRGFSCMNYKRIGWNVEVTGLMN